MTTLRLEAHAGTPLDLVIGTRRCTLWRRGGVVLLAIDDAEVGRMRRELAFLGVRATSTADVVPTPPPLVRAVGVGLAPVQLQDGELDLIEVEPIALADATARVLRRPFRAWPIGRRRKSRCRALLRGMDAGFEARRTAWCTRATLRAAGGSLRPALFDRAARSRAHRLFASDAHLSRWIRA